MADVKISGLPAATTPLVGTEVLPIVQSSTTKKVSVDNLTAGKAVSALSMTATNLKTSPATANLDISGTTIAAAGSDANVDVNINAKGTGVAYLNQRWGVNASGALVASAGNTYDIGNGAANPRDVNLDRNLVIKGSSTGTTAVGSLNASASNYTANLPAANTNIPIASQVLTFSGPSVARTITLPDANFTAARTDAGQTFTGNQTISGSLTATGSSQVGDTSVAAQRIFSIFGASTANTVNSIVRLWGDGTGTNTRYVELKAKTATFIDQVSAIISVNNGDGGGQVDALTAKYDGDVSVNVGNLVIGTSGKGIDFSATANGPNMTSELLTDYEEGTWTPTVISLGVAGTPTYTGSYTKVGRVVHFTLTIESTGNTSATYPNTVFSLPFEQNGAPVSSASVSTGSTALDGAQLVTLYIYPPTWTNQSFVIISGSYFV